MAGAFQLLERRAPTKVLQFNFRFNFTMFAKFANIVSGCKNIVIVNRGNKLVHSRVLSSRLDGINRSGNIERNVWSLKRPGGLKMQVRAATFWSGSSVHHRIALEVLAVRGADGSQYVS